MYQNTKCSFCSLVVQLQLDREGLDDDDREVIARHMRLAHGLQRYSVPR